MVAGSVYAGVDALAAAIVDRVRWLPGPVQYPYAAVRALATYRPARYRVVVDGSSASTTPPPSSSPTPATTARGWRSRPPPSLDDGLLDVVVIEAASKRELIRSLPTVYDGSHVALPEVTVLTGARIELSADARVPVPVGGDGEPLGVLPSLASPPAVASVLPRALAVIA